MFNFIIVNSTYVFGNCVAAGYCYYYTTGYYTTGYYMNVLSSLYSNIWLYWFVVIFAFNIKKKVLDENVCGRSPST